MRRAAIAILAPTVALRGITQKQADDATAQIESAIAADSRCTC